MDPSLIPVGALFVIIGASAMFLLWASARLARQRREEIGATDVPDIPIDLASTSDAVIVANPGGHILSANRQARHWFGMDGSEVDLWIMAQQVRPSEAFLQLFAAEGRAVLQMAERRVEATSHQIMVGESPQFIVVLREQAPAPPLDKEERDSKQATLAISEISRAISSSLDLETTLDSLLTNLVRLIQYDAAEVCLYDADKKVLRPVGRKGDSSYHAQLEQLGGVYQLDEGYSGWIARHQQPLVIADLARRTDVRPKIDITEMPFRSYIGVPLMVRSRFIGTLEAMSVDANAYDAEDLSLLNIVADQSAIAIENAQLYGQQEERVAELSGLQQIASALGSLQDPYQLYEQLNKRIADLLNVEMCTVLLHEEDEQALVPAVPAHGVPDNIVRMYRIPLTKGSSARAFWEETPFWYSNRVLREDLVNDLGLEGLARAVGVRQTALAPMMIGDERIGVVQIANKRDESNITLDDIRLLQIYAAQAAIVVENARLYSGEQNRVAELQGLQRISQAMNALSDPKELYGQLSSRIGELMNVEMCGILIHNDETNSLISRPPFYGVADDLIRSYQIPLPEGSLARDIWETREVHISNDVANDPMSTELGLDEFAQTVGVRSTLFVPLSSSGRRFGVIQTSNKKDGSDFDEDDARILSIFASQAAALIENARLYEETDDNLRNRIEELRSVSRVSRELNATLELDRILRVISEEAVRAEGASCGGVLMIDLPASLTGERDHFACQGGDFGALQRHVLEAGELIVVEDFRSEARFDPPHEGIRSALVAPINFEGEIVGVIELHSNRPGTLGPSAVEFVAALADQAAIAVGNATRYAEQVTRGELLHKRAEQLTQIFELGRLFRSDQSVEENLDTIAYGVQEAVDFDVVAISIVNEKDQQLQYVSTAGLPVLTQEEIKRESIPVERVTPLLQDEFAISGSYFIPHENTELDNGAFKPWRDGSQAGSPPASPNGWHPQDLLVVPLKSKAGQLLGLLNVDRPRNGTRPTQAVVETLEIFANQAALIIENSRLYHSMEERADELSRSLEDLEKSYQELDELSRDMIQKDLELSVANERLDQRAKRLLALHRVMESIDTTQSPDGVLHTIAHSVVREMDLDVCLIATEQLPGVSNTPLRLVASAGKVPDDLDLSAHLLPDDPILQSNENARGRLLSRGNGKQPTRLAQVLNLRSLVAQPLALGNDGRGMLLAGNQAGNVPLADEDLDLFALLASQVTVEYENARLYHAVQNEARVASSERDLLQNLHLVTTALQQTREMTVRLKTITSGLQTVGYSKVALLLFDKEMNVTNMVTAGYEAVEETAFRQQLPPAEKWQTIFEDQTFLGMRVGSSYYLPFDDPWVVDNIWNGERPEGKREAGHWNPNDLLFLPMYGGDRVIGLISLGGTIEEEIVTAETMRPLELFAQQAASALENAYLYQETLELQSYNEAVVDSIQQGIIVLSAEGTITLTNDFIRSLQPADEELIGHDLFEAFPDWRKLGLADEIKRVESEGKPHEMLGVNYKPANAAPSLLNIYVYPLSMDATQGGTVVLVEDFTSHAQLEEDVALRGQQLAALSDVARVITATLKAEDVINLVMEEMDSVVAFDSVALWLRDKDTDSLRIVAARGYDDDASMTGLTVELDDSQLFTEMARERQPLVVGDVREDPRFPASEMRPTRSWLGAPLTSQEDILGVITVDKVEKEYYDNADAQVLLAFAGQAAIALENARLYQEVAERVAELDLRTQRLALLNRVSAGLGTTLELENILNSAITELVRALDADRSSAVLIEEDGQTARILASHPNGKAAEEDVAFPVKGNKALDHIRETKAPLTCEDAQADPLLESVHDIMKKQGVKSTLILPLVAGGTLIGVIHVDSTKKRRRFDPDLIALAQAIANQVAVATSNARLFEETAERSRELEILFAASQAASSSLELDDVLTGIGRFLTEAIPIEGYRVSLWDRETDEVVTLFDDAKSESEDELAGRDKRSALAQLPTTRQVLESGNPVTLHISDSDADPLELETMKEQGIGTNLMLPLVTRGATIGLLELRHSSEEHHFTQRDMRLAQALANQTATAVENARLHDETQRRVEELATINRIGRAITSAITTEDLYGTLYDEIGEVVGARSMVIALHDTVTNQTLFPIVIRDGEREKRAAQPFGEGIYAHVISSGDSLLLNGDVAALAKDQLGVSDIEPEIRSFLAIPFFTAERAVGALAVLDYEDENAFDKADMHMLETTAAQVAVSIQNARLYDQLQNRLGETTALQEVSRVVNSSLDLEEIFERLVEELAYAFRYPLIALFTIEDDKLVLQTQQGYSEEDAASFQEMPLEKGVVGRVARTGVPTFIEDVTTDEDYVRIQEWVTNELTVPISSDARTLGVINVEAGADRPLSPNDMSLLVTLAGQVATAMENARLYDEMISLSSELERRVEERTRELQSERDTMDTLFRITSELSASLDLDLVLNRALELVGQAVGAEHGSLFLIDPQSERLIWRAVMSDYEVLPPGGRQIPLTRHEGMAGWVMDNRQALLIDNVQEDPRWVNIPGTEERRSMLAAPLIANEDVLGVVIMMSDVPDLFSEAHLRLVEAAANQVATAINNAELYRLIRDQAERLGSMLRSQQVEASKSQAILESVADGVMVSDAAGEIILFNAAAERILDLKRDEVLGRPTAELTGLYGGGAQRWARVMDEWMNDPTTYEEGDFLQERLTVGEKFISVHLSPVTHGDEFLGLVSVFRDITREVEVDRMKSEFVSTVSHELRTPMTSIKGYADLLLMKGTVEDSLNEEQKQFLEIIKNNADRLSLLVNDLLDISRIEQGRVQLELADININEVISDLMDSLNVRFANEEKVVNMSVEVPDDLPGVQADYERVMQILLNIVLNAYQYTPEGGSVTIRTEAEEDGVRVDVEDTGIGIDEADQERIFERFWRGEDPTVMATAGTGLGLSIVKNLVEMHQGKLSLESEVGTGTTFSILFPYQRQESRAERVAAE